MAKVYKTPGVYIEEIPTLPPSIAEVETAIPAFIGYTSKATFNGKSLVLLPTRITSLLEYIELFGGAQSEPMITVTITDEMADASTLTSRTIIPSLLDADKSRFKMYYSLQMYFANGGGPCYICSVGTYPGTAPADGDIVKSKLKDGLDEIAKVDEPTLIVFPDATTLGNSEYLTLIDEALTQCRDLQDRFVIMDVKPDTTGTNVITASMNTFRNATQLGNQIDKLKYGAAYFPNLDTVLNYKYNESDVSITYIQKVGTAAPVTLTTTDADPDQETLKLTEIKSVPATLDAAIKTGLGLPSTELYNKVKLELQNLTMTLPPSSAVAGVYATVDNSRGVWKAPANVSLSYVNAAAVKISDLDQRDLNVDPTSGKSINAIRYFTGKGLLVWGARTLAGNDNEWRYVSVRRFFNFAEESIKKGTQWVVFEPNDANTWVRVKSMIESFLVKQWRAGALAGAKPEHAFYVKVGLGVTMTSLDILEGRMNIEIGMAVVRPAEFIILKFSHKLQES